MNNAEPVIFGENHLRIEDLLALDLQAADPVARTLVDHVGNGEPLPTFVKIKLPSDACLEEAEAAVVRCDPFGILLYFHVVHMSTIEPSQPSR